MKVGKRVAAVSLASVVGLGASVAAIVSGCGGNGSDPPGGGGNGSTACGNPGQPPCSTGPATTLTTRHNYAIHHLFLGDIDPVTGQENPAIAWKNYGYNLDGKDTTVSSTDACIQMRGAQAKVQQDGPGGIDNSFGENLLPIIVGLEPTASSSVNAAIAQGQFTVMFDVNGFDDSAGNMTSATALSGVILAGADVSAAGAPTWTPTFDWAVRPELLDCSPNCQGVTDPASHSTVKMGGSYQAGGTFVSGSPTQISLSLAVAGQTLQLNILSALITFQADSPGHVKNGIIAGALLTSDVIQQIRNVVGFLAGGSLCAGAALQQIESEIANASDIVVSGNTVSNDSTAMCNAISIGLGFDGDEIAQPATVAPAATGGTNPCDMVAGDAGAN